jgi:hypothetical protein
MHWIAERTIFFFIDNFPSPPAIVIGGLLWSYVCLYFAGYLKKNKGLKTGYARNVFHFLILARVVTIQLLWGTSIVCLFGGMVTIVILYAILRGDAHLLYEAMASTLARDTDITPGKSSKLHVF